MTYWQKRYDQIEQAAHDKAVAYYSALDKKYSRAQAEIDKEINAWYQRFAVNNKIDYTEARRLLNSDELDEFRWSVEDYIKAGEQNDVDGRWMKELENASARHHVNRLEALKLSTTNSIEKAMGGMTDDVDKMLRDVYKSTYYKGCYEFQRGTGIGFDLAKVNDRYLDAILKKPWCADGSNFSDKIWKNKTKLVNELDNELMRMALTGDAPGESIRRISKALHTSKNNAATLVMTEQAFFTSIAQQDAFKELGVGEFEVVATLDGLTCTTCGSHDGEHRPMSEFKPGITAPPYHPNCRCTTVPYFDDEFDAVGKRAARGADGKTYHVPGDMKYADWKEQYIDSPVVVDQTQKITKKNDFNDYSVDRKLVNSKEYHDKFENLTSHKSTNESVYQEAMKMLEHRDGTDLEDIVILDARTGNVIVKNTLSVRSGQTGLTHEQFEIYQQSSGKKVLLHNHPNGGRLSFTDLKTLFVNDDIKATIAVGHNGMVHIVSNPDRTLDIEKLYESLYNEYKEIYANSELARIYALDDLYDLKIFDYESR
ncbi:MAG: minor capsid protein [Clostridia bacterium]|nr:minor capsid protein [Clostridia bacterium]